MGMWVDRPTDIRPTTGGSGRVEPGWVDPVDGSVPVGRTGRTGRTPVDRLFSVSQRNQSDPSPVLYV